MKKEVFSDIRRLLGKTQLQMAQLLGVSHKAIQSFEQGWRHIPGYIERLALFILAMKTSGNTAKKSCWEIMNCSKEAKRKCPAWEFQLGHLCWFINGTIWQGKAMSSWQDKMEICQKCEIFKSMLPHFCIA